MQNLMYMRFSLKWFEQFRKYLRVLQKWMFLILVFHSLIFMFCRLLFHLTLWSGLLCACNILILSTTSDLKAVRLGTYRWLDQIQVARITRRRASAVCVSGFGASWARERIELSASFLHVECHVILLLKASELNHNNRVQNQKWWADLMRVVFTTMFPFQANWETQLEF